MSHLLTKGRASFSFQRPRVMLSGREGVADGDYRKEGMEQTLGKVCIMTKRRRPPCDGLPEPRRGQAPP